MTTMLPHTKGRRSDENRDAAAACEPASINGRGQVDGSKAGAGGKELSGTAANGALRRRRQQRESTRGTRDGFQSTAPAESGRRCKAERKTCASLQRPGRGSGAARRVAELKEPRAGSGEHTLFPARSQAPRLLRSESCSCGACRSICSRSVCDEGATCALHGYAQQSKGLVAAEGKSEGEQSGAREGPELNPDEAERSRVERRTGAEAGLGDRAGKANAGNLALRSRGRFPE